MSDTEQHYINNKTSKQMFVGNRQFTTQHHRVLKNVIDIWFGLNILLCLSLAYYAQEVVVEIGDNERGRFKIRWIWEDFPLTKYWGLALAVYIY